VGPRRRRIVRAALRHSGLQLDGRGPIGLLTLVAAILLAVTGRYPRGLYDFILGLNRWVLRVTAYASLMTDAYPPFRLDTGGSNPTTVIARTP
jgi:hypothetical protein